MIRYVAIFLVVALLNGTVVAQDIPSPANEPPYRVIVQFRTAFTPENDLADAVQVQRQRIQIQNSQKDTLNLLRNQRAETENVRLFQTVPLAALTVDARGLAALEGDPDIIAIYEDQPMRLQMTEVNQVIGSAHPWSLGLDGSGVVVAILDTGIDFNHPAFAGKRISEACFSAGDCPNGQSTQYGFGASHPQICLECTHGTQMAGIAAGNTPDFKGVAPGAGLIGVNVFSLFDDESFCGEDNTPCAASYTSDQIAGMEYVYNLRHNYTIAAVNMSLGGGRYYDPCLVQAGAYTTIVNNLRSVNIAVIAAAGNNAFDESISSPACHPDIISVGATTDNDFITGFTNLAYFMDLLAPGSNVHSATTAPDTEAYATGSGTSQATAVTTGAWAILRQAYPRNSVVDNLNYLQLTGEPISFTVPDYFYTFPRINLSAITDLGLPNITISEQALLAALRNETQPGMRVILVVYEFDRADIYLEIDGFTGIVPVRTPPATTLGVFRLDAATDLNGQPAPASYVETANSVLPGMLVGALDALLAEYSDITVDFIRIQGRMWGVWTR